MHRVDTGKLLLKEIERKIHKRVKPPVLDWKAEVRKHVQWKHGMTIRTVRGTHKAETGRDWGF